MDINQGKTILKNHEIKAKGISNYQGDVSSKPKIENEQAPFIEMIKKEQNQGLVSNLSSESQTELIILSPNNPLKEKSNLSELTLSIESEEREKEKGSRKNSVESEDVTTVEDKDNQIGFSYKQSYSEKHKKLILLIKYLPSFIGFFSYLISLRGCYDPFFVCVIIFERVILNNIVIPFTIIAAASFYFQFLIIKYCFNDNDKLKRLKYYIPPIASIAILILLDRGAGFDYHGFFNIMILTLFFTIFFLIENILMCVRYLALTYKKTALAMLFALLVVFIITWVKLTPTLDRSCGDWDKGFKGSKIDNKNSKCIINKPNICLMTLMNGWFNYSYWTNSTCGNMIKGSYESVKEVLTDKTAKVIGYPRTNNWDWMQDAKRKYFNTKVRSNIINMEDQNIHLDIKEEIETIVDFNFDPAKVSINLKKNNTLSELRAQVFAEDTLHSVLTSNILVLYIDSLSRPDFKRKLPLLYAWIENFYRSPKNSTHESFQFFKYHAVGRYTLLNNLPAFWGTYSLNQTQYGRFYLENYKKRGYVTGNAQNHCAKETVPSDDIAEIHYSNYDHELNGFFCDPNNESSNNTVSNFHGSNSMTPRCLYGKHTGEYSMEYALQFFQTYKDNAKLFHLGLMDNHEMTSEGISLLDSYILRFLEEFKRQGHLDNTTIIFQTDHGHAFLSFYNVVKSSDHEKELVLPSLFLVIPKGRFSEYNSLRENLIANENSLITPFTIYNSYQALIGYEKETKARYSNFNIFKTKIPRSENCTEFYDEDYFSVAEYLCRCE